MPIARLLQSRFGAAFAAAVLAACSGGNAVAPNPSIATAAARTLTLHAKSHGPLVYVSDSLGNFVDVFAKNGTLLGKITNGLNYPVELFVDAKHNLWVANSGGDVLEFKRGATTAAAAYRGVTNPYATTLCPNGDLYVANLSGTISVFAHGHHMPTRFLKENYGGADSIECDAKGNVFITATVFSPPGYVVKFPHGKNRAKMLPLLLPNPIDAKPDPAGDLLILDATGGPYNTVAEYTERGSPTGKSMPNGANWSQLALTPNAHGVFGSDVNDLEGVEMAFPSGKLLQTYVDSSFRQLGGIAYDPG